MTRRPARQKSSGLSVEEALGRATAHWRAGQSDQAEKLCRRILTAHPGQPDALHMLGVMAHARGDLDLALRRLRQACRSPRAPAGYLSNLTELCRLKGLLDEGEQAGRRAVALDPNLPTAWSNLGILLQGSGKLEESLACLERVAALTPERPETHNNLANAYRSVGRDDRAETHYRKALALRPDYADPHSNLANLLRERGDYDAAAEAARRAIAINPRFTEAYINLAALECDRNRHKEALACIESLLAFAPAHAGGIGALIALAATLSRLDLPDEALYAARRAVTLAPDNADAHHALGLVLGQIDQTEAAFAAFDRAQSLPGTKAENAGIAKASLLMVMGRKAEARAEADRVLAAEPHSIQAWGIRAQIKRFTADDPDIGRLETLLDGSETASSEDRQSLRFSLGKAWLEAGDATKAFAHFDEGNRLKRAEFDFDIAATLDWLDDIARTFSPSLLARGTALGNSSTRPIFILGMPRSGTTLVEQILASHPDVHGAGELTILQKLANEIPDYPEGAARLTETDIAALARRYLDRIDKLGAGCRHVVDKMPSNFLHVGLIRLLLPEARIIHTRRDPVDTCLSCYTKLFTGVQLFAYDQAELGRFHRGYRTLMEHWRQTVPADHLIDIDYEAMVGDQEGETRRLLAFLDLPWSESCTRFYDTARQVRTASTSQVRQPIYASSVGRWRRYADHLGPLLDALGV